MLSEKTIEELRLILREDYGKDLSTADVSEIANGMVGYFDLLAKIYYRKNNNENNDDQRPEKRID